MSDISLVFVYISFRKDGLMGLAQMSAPHVEGELGLREVQLESLKILKDIDAVCRREGIRYWLAFGSLIGVVRHQGFIPWDDDLDIIMPRQDYERFLTCFDGCAQELEPYVPVIPEFGLRRPFLITRVSNPEFKMVGEYGDEVDELGTFVDVYPIDGLADDMEGALGRKKAAYELTFQYLKACNFDCNNRNNGPLKRFGKRIQSLLLGKPEKYQEKLMELCLERRFDDCKLCCNLGWSMTVDKSIYERSWFDETVRMKFEDMEVPVPVGYDAFLRSDYGDYMQLPPESERVGHHFYSIVKRAAK